MSAVEELLLWRDPIRSGIVLGGATFLYILLVRHPMPSCCLHTARLSSTVDEIRAETSDGVVMIPILT